MLTTTRRRRGLPTAWYTSAQACERAGVTYRQLDCWARSGAARPTVTANGSGSLRMWSPSEITVLRVLGRLSRLGCAGDCFVRAGQEMSRLAADKHLVGWILVTPDGCVSIGKQFPKEAGWCIPVDPDSVLNRRVS